MPSGIQLRELIRGVRAEAGHSLSEAHGQAKRETLAYLLQRKQRSLWRAHDWPLLTHYWDQTFEAGDRYINYPDDVDPNRVNKVEHQWDSSWFLIPHGISMEDRSLYDSDGGERSDPLRKWQHYWIPGMTVDQLGQMELYPIPASDGTVRVHGHARLASLVDDDDICTLDSDMLVLYVAGELLARSAKADSELKLREAESIRRNILGQSGADRSSMATYGGTRRTPGLRPGLDFIVKRPA